MAGKKVEAEYRWKCRECGHVCASGDILSAPHPFRPEEELSGCPSCRSAESMIGACSSEGCPNEADMGCPNMFGFRYVWLCWDHSPQNPNAKPANVRAATEGEG